MKITQGKKSDGCEVLGYDEEGEPFELHNFTSWLPGSPCFCGSHTITDSPEYAFNYIRMMRQQYGDEEGDRLQREYDAWLMMPHRA